jgi:hypothetical protein
MSLHLRNIFRNETLIMAGTLSPRDLPYAQRIHKPAPRASVVPGTLGAARTAMNLTAAQPVRDPSDLDFCKEEGQTNLSCALQPKIAEA